MKREKQNIKRLIKKKIELRQGIGYLQPKKNIKSGVMDDRTKVRLGLLNRVPTKVPTRIQINVDSMNSRDRLRIFGTEKVVNYLPILEDKNPVTIIVTAYQTQNYIEECLNSIERQTYFIDNNNYEVLVGVDGCKKTLNKLLKIRHKYRNLRIFSMNKNVGTFITTNTLIEIMNTDNFIRFDSDDIMLPEMINEIMYFSDNYDVIQFSYYNFNGKGYRYLKNMGNPYAAGVIFFKKKVFDIYGGYQPWVCTAEGEILVRIGNDLKRKKIPLGLFNRRVHNESLTQHNVTGMKSELRKKYHRLIEVSREENIKLIERVTGKYKEYEN